MKIAKKKVRITSPLVNPIIDLERPLEKVLKKGEYIAIIRLGMTKLRRTKSIDFLFGEFRFVRAE